MGKWSIGRSAELYNLPGWGRGLFGVNEAGNLTINPDRETELDLKQMTEDLCDRGVQFPMLLRFPQVARRRLNLLVKCFGEAKEKYAFGGAYRPVYPIKVNQQADLVGDLAGQDSPLGLEAGSKPELLASMAMLGGTGSLLICNGYKDEAYIRTAFSAQKLGHEVVIVIEKLSELPIVLDMAEELGMKPRIGVRARLSRPGAGRWKKSAGDKAKFGLSAAGIMLLVEQLEERGKLGWLRLLHFHIGSQVSNIRTFKRALREATRLYAELVKLGAPLGLFDVGGGVGVDYDGSSTDFESSMNYSLREYALDVVSAITDECESQGIAHPDLVTECGRALVAHSSVLLFDVVGRESVRTAEPEVEENEADIVVEMREVLAKVNARTAAECWHDALDGRERGRQAFELGVGSLRTLALVERLYWAVVAKISRSMRHGERVPEELEDLDKDLADTYYGNFSLFQSLPDSWAVEQLFPIVPIHRLDEEPTARAVLADLTCDSDGRIDRFVSPRDIKRTLEVHELREGEDYVLAVCLVGAYQEILGDLHNLFGDTHAVHVVAKDGRPVFEKVMDGDTVLDALRYVAYTSEDLVHRVRRTADEAIERGELTPKAAAKLIKAYRDGLKSYTYLGG